jgi:hypothetical protein
MLFIIMLCHYAGCRMLSVTLLSPIMLSCIMLTVIILSVSNAKSIMLTVIMLSVFYAKSNYTGCHYADYHYAVSLC